MNHLNSHTHDLRPFRHGHAFADPGQARRERALTWVTLLTLATMAVELLAGWWTGSLALTADGWHMGTHALALGGAVLAYRLSLRAASHRALPGGAAGYAFGGWKIEVLAAYTSGLVLLGVALWLVWEGVATLLQPRSVNYADALVVAVVGLVVNLVSIWLLAPAADGPKAADAHRQDGSAAPEQPGQVDEHHGVGFGDHGSHQQGHQHSHHRGHQHGHHHGHHRGHHHDHNFNAAYLHVLADAFTSVLAIVALAGGAWYGLNWLDPAVALLGAAVIGQWAWRMLGSTATALVDATEDPAITQRIRDLIESDGDAKLADLHVWQVGAQAWSAALAVVADAPLPAADYRLRLAAVQQLKHVTVEVHACSGAAPAHD